MSKFNGWQPHDVIPAVLLLFDAEPSAALGAE